MNRIEQLEAFLKDSPQDPFLHYALTMEYVKLGDEVEAQSRFNMMTEKYPDYIGTYYHFGKFLEKIGDREQAEKIYQVGIQKATSLRNHHAKGELMAALNMLNGIADDDDDY